MAEPRRRRALLVADDDDLFGLAQALLSVQGFEVAPRGEEMIGAPVAKALRASFKAADVAVFVLDARGLTPNLAYEIGVATGLAIPLIVVASNTDSLPPPITARGVVIAADRATLPSALSFALSRYKPRKGPRGRQRPKELTGSQRTHESVGLPTHESVGARSPDRVELDLVASVRALIESSGEVVSGGSGRHSTDLGIWVDDLAGLVGAPLFIEVKSELRSSRAAQAFQQIAKLLPRSGTHWALLVYFAGVESELANEWAQAWPVLPIRFDDFLERVRDRGFVELVRELRSRRIHSSLP